MRSSLAPLALGALLAVSATAGEARANPRAPEVLSALEALRTQRYEDALKACAAGPQGEIQPECPLIRAHSLHALGRHLEAYEALRIFGVQGGEEAKNAPVAREAFRSVLLSHLARVSVVCSAPGPAEVLVNGKLARTCPTTGPIVTSPGEVVIEVKKVGFEAAQIKVPVTAGGTVTARIDLVPAGGSIPAPKTEPKTAPKIEPKTEPKTALKIEPKTAPSEQERPEAIPEANSKPSQEAIQEPKEELNQKTQKEPSQPGAPAAKTTRPTTDTGPPPSTQSLSSDKPSSADTGNSRTCGSRCKTVLIAIGGLAVIGAVVTVTLIATRETLPADKGDIPPGQVKVPLVAW